MRGTVLTTRGGPLRGAQVRLASNTLRASRTDEQGRFTLRQVLAGPVTLQVRAVGFVPQDFDMKTPATTDVTLRVALQPIPVRDSVGATTTARAGSALMADFWTRRERESGLFFTRTDLDAHNTGNALDMLRMVPGVRIRPLGLVGYNNHVEFDRCRDPVVFVDGAEMRGDAGDALQKIDARSLDAVEIYTGASRIPMVFRAPNKCAVIALWTRIN